MKPKILSKPKITRMPLTKARINLGAIIKRVHIEKERFLLEKDGMPVAVIMDADEYEDYWETHDPESIKQIEESRKDYEAGRFRDAWKFLDELRQDEIKSRKRSVIKK